MTKKDYKMIAGVIANQELIPGQTEVISRFALVQDLAKVLEEDNPRFNKTKFFHACYPES